MCSALFLHLPVLLLLSLTKMSVGAIRRAEGRAENVFGIFLWAGWLLVRCQHISHLLLSFERGCSEKCKLRLCLHAVRFSGGFACKIGVKRSILYMPKLWL